MNTCTCDKCGKEIYEGMGYRLARAKFIEEEWTICLQLRYTKQFEQEMDLCNDCFKQAMGQISKSLVRLTGRIGNLLETADALSASKTIDVKAKPKERVYYLVVEAEEGHVVRSGLVVEVSKDEDGDENYHIRNKVGIIIQRLGENIYIGESEAKADACVRNKVK